MSHEWVRLYPEFDQIYSTLEMLNMIDKMNGLTSDASAIPKKRSDLWRCERCGCIAISEVGENPKEGTDLNQNQVMDSIIVPPCDIMITREVMKS